MKKITLFTIFAAILGGGNLRAQDTLWMKPAPLSDYYNNNWFDTTVRYVGSTVTFSDGQMIARRFIVKDDSLQVYGIAAMMANFDALTFRPSSTYPDLLSYLVSDTNYSHCEEWLTLYQYQGTTTPSMQQVGDSLPVNIIKTPVSHWIMSNTPVVSYLDTFPKPVYERYFSVPQTVHDTFYAGFSQQAGRPWNYQFGCLAFGYPDQRNLDEVVAVLYRPNAEWIFHNNYNHEVYYIFPIITPPDTTINPGDTINPGGDTLAIDRNDPVYRYTNVAPNPATETVRVTSSFGLSRIEAYDLKGHLISEFRTPNSEFSTTLDVSSWPRGTYLLRITTPAGPTTKKLLIQ